MRKLLSLTPFGWLALLMILGLVIWGCPQKSGEQPAPGATGEITITPATPSLLDTSLETMAQVPKIPNFVSKEGRIDPFYVPLAGKKEAKAEIRRPGGGGVMAKKTIAPLPFYVTGIVKSGSRYLALIYNENQGRSMIAGAGEFLGAEKTYRIKSITEKEVVVGWDNSQDVLSLEELYTEPYPARKVMEEKAGAEATPSLVVPAEQRPGVLPPPPPPPGGGQEVAPPPPPSPGGSPVAPPAPPAAPTQ